MSVAPFVLPCLISFCVVLLCISLFFIRVRFLQSISRHDEHGEPELQISPLIHRPPLPVMLLTWPALVFALLSSAVVGGTACGVGFYPIYPAPLAGTFALVGPASTTLLSARDGSVQQKHIFTGRSGWATSGADAMPVVASALPTVANGIAYFNNEDSTSHTLLVSAYRLSDGSLLWSTTVRTPRMSGQNSSSQLINEAAVLPPVVANGMVYVEQTYWLLTGQRQVLAQFSALHVSSGRLAWSLPLQRIGLFSDPSAAEMKAGDGVFVVSTSDGSISAWHAADGSAAWHFDAHALSQESQLLTLVEAEQTVFVGIGTPEDPLLIALRIDNGQRLWLKHIPFEQINLLSRYGTHLYLNDGNGLEVLDATNGNLLWTVTWENPEEAVEANGVVYVTQQASTLDAFKGSDGSLIWTHPFTFPTTHASLGGLSIINHVLFVHSSKDYHPDYSFHFVVCPGAYEPVNALFALNANDGSIYWRTLNIDGFFTPYTS